MKQRGSCSTSEQDWSPCCSFYWMCWIPDSQLMKWVSGNTDVFFSQQVVIFVAMSMKRTVCVDGGWAVSRGSTEAEAAAACVYSGSDWALLLGGRVETELQRNQRRWAALRSAVTLCPVHHPPCVFLWMWHSIISGSAAALSFDSVSADTLTLLHLLHSFIQSHILNTNKLSRLFLFKTT